MTDDIDLASLQEAILDAATIDQLFFDLGQVAEIIEVSIKSSAHAHAASASPTLDTARRALAGGEALAVQIRYRHAGVEWIDTLFRVTDGVRIVRMQVP